MQLFKRKDLLILCILVIGTLSLYFFISFLNHGKGTKAEIYYKNSLVQTIPLNQKKDCVFVSSVNKNIVFHLYPDGSICFESSDCPDKICIRSGRLRHPGESAACIPNQMFLKIVAPKKNQEVPDGITR